MRSCALFQDTTPRRNGENAIQRYVSNDLFNVRQMQFDRICCADNVDGLGIECIAFVEIGDFTLNLFELYCCVKLHGGNDKLCEDKRWHHVAYELCRASKRNKLATAAVRKGYEQYLAPYWAQLRDVKMKPFNSIGFEDSIFKPEEDNNRLRDLSRCDSVSLEWVPTKQNLRSQGQTPRRNLNRRFKGRVSFDLLSTIPLYTSSDTKDFLNCIVPGQRLPSTSPEVFDTPPRFSNPQSGIFKQLDYRVFRWQELNGLWRCLI